MQELTKHGFAFVQLESCDYASLSKQFLDLASTVGVLQPTRSKLLVDSLVPLEKGQAHPKSLSALFGLGGQPWHVDLAHNKIPAQYILLMCVHVGSRPVATELVYWKNLLDIDDHNAAHTETFLVRNGARSFYATILGRKQKFVRYDPGCMQPVTMGARTLMRTLLGKKVEPTVRINWRPGLAVIIDNWRMLHRRLDAHGAQDRLLLRISVMGESRNE